MFGGELIWQSVAFKGCLVLFCPIFTKYIRITLIQASLLLANESTCTIENPSQLDKRPVQVQ
jgi:hypothetical protein